MLAERLDLERVLQAVPVGDGLVLQVDAERETWLAVRPVSQRIALLLGQPDQQQAVLGRVVEEDVAVRRGDDRLEAVLLERPRRVLARGATPEGVTGDEDVAV